MSMNLEEKNKPSKFSATSQKRGLTSYSCCCKPEPASRSVILHLHSLAQSGASETPPQQPRHSSRCPHRVRPACNPTILTTWSHCTQCKVVAESEFRIILVPGKLYSGLGRNTVQSLTRVISMVLETDKCGCQQIQNSSTIS